MYKKEKRLVSEMFHACFVVGPLSSCANGETCTGGSYCQNGMCVCSSDSVVRDSRCVRQRMGILILKQDIFVFVLLQSILVPPGGPCPSESEVCTGGSNCYYSVCTCPSGQVIRNNLCSVGSMGKPFYAAC